MPMAMVNMDRLRKVIRKIKGSGKEIHQIFHSIMIVLNDFRAGHYLLADLLNNSRARKFQDFQLFL